MDYNVTIQRANMLGPRGALNKGWIAFRSNDCFAGYTTGSREGLEDVIRVANPKDRFSFENIKGTYNNGDPIDPETIEQR